MSSVLHGNMVSELRVQSLVNGEAFGSVECVARLNIEGALRANEKNVMDKIGGM